MVDDDVSLMRKVFCRDSTTQPLVAGECIACRALRITTTTTTKCRRVKKNRNNKEKNVLFSRKTLLQGDGSDMVICLKILDAHSENKGFCFFGTQKYIRSLHGIMSLNQVLT